MLAELQAGVRHRRARWWSTPAPAPAPGRPRWSTRSRPGDAVLAFETGHFAHAVAGDGDRARARGRPRAGRLAARRRPRAWWPSGSRRTPSTRIKAVCVVHNETSTGVTSRVARGPRGHRRGGPPGPAARRHHLLARLDRLPPRRVGRRRHRRRFAEGPDAAAGARLQRGQREGARGVRSPPSCRGPTGTGRRSSPPTPTASSPTPRRTNLLYGLRGRAADARRGGPAERLRPPPAARRGDPRGGAGLGPRGALPRRARALGVADRGAAARRARRRRGAPGRPRPLRHVAGRRARQARRQDLPHRPPRPLQRPDARRHAGRRADGAGDRRGAGQAGRRRRRRWRVLEQEAATA